MEDDLILPPGSLNVLAEDPTPPPQAADPAVVRQATEARLAAAASSSSQTHHTKAESEARFAFYRIIDSIILEKSLKAVAVPAMETLLKITSNALDNPGVEKFRSLKTNNAMIKKHILEVPGARDYLLACKFAPKTVQFIETLHYPLEPTPFQLSALTTGRDVLRTKLTIATAAKETEDRMKQSAKAVESTRTARALEAASEDRERKALRDQWAREARLKRSATEGDHQAEL